MARTGVPSRAHLCSALHPHSLHKRTSRESASSSPWFLRIPTSASSVHWFACRKRKKYSWPYSCCRRANMCGSSPRQVRTEQGLFPVLSAVIRRQHSRPLVQAEQVDEQASGWLQQSVELDKQAARLSDPANFAQSSKLQRRAVVLAKAAKRLQVDKVSTASSLLALPCAFLCTPDHLKQASALTGGLVGPPSPPSTANKPGCACICTVFLARQQACQSHIWLQLETFCCLFQLSICFFSIARCDPRSGLDLLLRQGEQLPAKAICEALVATCKSALARIDCLLWGILCLVILFWSSSTARQSHSQQEQGHGLRSWKVVWGLEMHNWYSLLTSDVSHACWTHVVLKEWQSPAGCQATRNC